MIVAERGRVRAALDAIEAQPLSTRELAARLGVTKQQAAETVCQLRASGWIERSTELDSGPHSGGGRKPYRWRFADDAS